VGRAALLAYHGEHIGMAEAGLLRPAVPRLASVSPKVRVRSHRRLAPSRMHATSDS
jgi:hypothetical protein